jgi:hypothetical protein
MRRRASTDWLPVFHAPILEEFVTWMISSGKAERQAPQEKVRVAKYLLWAANGDASLAVDDCLLHLNNDRLLRSFQEDLNAHGVHATTNFFDAITTFIKFLKVRGCGSASKRSCGRAVVCASMYRCAYA